MNKLFHHFLKSEEGVTALEYGLIAGVIALAIGSTVLTLGGQLTSVFSDISTTLSTALPKTTGTNGG